MRFKIVAPDAQVAVPAISGYHDGVVVAAFGDGHVGMIPVDTKPEVLKALFTTAGGEDVDPSDL